MPQARRKTPAKPRAKTNTVKPAGYLVVAGLLVAGMLVGAFAMVLWQGARDGGNLGGGIAAVWCNITRCNADDGAPADTVTNTVSEGARVIRPSTSFDFYTVLKNEVVVPPETVADSAPGDAAAPQIVDKSIANTVSNPNAARVSAYMLQVGSYRDPAAAERQKVTLAFRGLSSSIQTIRLQDGDVYRVQLGPFPSIAAMKITEQQLTAAGFSALMIKVSGSQKSNAASSKEKSEAAN